MSQKSSSGPLVAAVGLAFGAGMFLYAVSRSSQPATPTPTPPPKPDPPAPQGLPEPRPPGPESSQPPRAWPAYTPPPRPSAQIDVVKDRQPASQRQLEDAYGLGWWNQDATERGLESFIEGVYGTPPQDDQLLEAYQLGKADRQQQRPPRYASARTPPQSSFGPVAQTGTYPSGAPQRPLPRPLSSDPGLARLQQESYVLGWLARDAQEPARMYNLGVDTTRPTNVVELQAWWDIGYAERAQAQWPLWSPDLVTGNQGRLPPAPPERQPTSVPVQPPPPPPPPAAGPKLSPGPLPSWVKPETALAAGYAVLYEHRDFQGNAYVLPVGRFAFLEDVAIPNDAISSVQVPAGYVLRMWEHRDFNGRTKEVRGDTLYIGDDWNDLMSSAEVARG